MQRHRMHKTCRFPFEGDRLAYSALWGALCKIVRFGSFTLLGIAKAGSASSKELTLTILGELNIVFAASLQTVSCGRAMRCQKH